MTTIQPVIQLWASQVTLIYSGLANVFFSFFLNFGCA